MEHHKPVSREEKIRIRYVKTVCFDHWANITVMRRDVKIPTRNGQQSTSRNYENPTAAMIKTRLPTRLCTVTSLLQLRAQGILGKGPSKKILAELVLRALVRKLDLRTYFYHGF